MHDGNSQQPPEVSVAMITFNHERYVTAAIQSVLDQKTSVPYEIVVADDCSTDATPTIIADFASRYPTVIRPILRQQNIGAARNFADTLAKCRGRYVAILEGDDLWTHHGKLEAQRDLLAARPNHSMCFTDARIIDGDGCETSPDFRPISSLPGALDVPDLLTRNPVPTCSAMFRRFSLAEIPRELLSLHLLDWPMWLLLATTGQIAFIPESWAAYRVHAQSSWSSQNVAVRNLRLADFFRRIAPFLERAPDRDAKQWARAALVQEKRHLEALIRWQVHAGRWQDARSVVWRFLNTPPRRSSVTRENWTLFLRLALGWPSAPMKQAAIARIDAAGS